MVGTGIFELPTPLAPQAVLRVQNPNEPLFLLSGRALSPVFSCLRHKNVTRPDFALA
jgi:hypothetical protein